MKENLLIFLTILVIAVSLCSIGAYNMYTTSKTQIEMGKAGLEQCVEGRLILWRKNCE